MRIAERHKTCPRCQMSKPWSDYYVRTRWEDGSTRTVMAYCKPCNAAKRKESYARHPGSKAASCVRYRARLANDPVRLANYRENQRFYNAAWRMRRGSNGVGLYSATLPDVAVDAAPFAAWLDHVLERDGLNVTQAARCLGVAEKMVREVLQGRRDRVMLSAVERALIADGTASLDDLYPRLFAEAA